jgi:3-dehydroquinate synthase
MKKINQQFSVEFDYSVHFTEQVFAPDNLLFAELLQSDAADVARNVLFVLDEGMYTHHPALPEKIREYTNANPDAFQLVDNFIVIPGGEAAKNDPSHVEHIHDAINDADLDRHSYVAAVGGGAVIDAAGYAAATAHRGIRMIRLPTTVLAQNDAAVGVKNGINGYGKKNFLGTFTPPYAVINDSGFLDTLEDRDWRAGISEAIKVALLKDADFFTFLDEQASLLSERDSSAMEKLIHRCAELHLDHISTSGDPFETGSSRPLDFGHWSAHKLEQLTDYELRHGEAVAIGIALDVTYSHLKGWLSEEEWVRILSTFKVSGFSLCVPELKHKMNAPDHPESIFHGLEEFREHLGGELTIMLLKGIGEGIEVHEVEYSLYREAVSLLETYEKDSTQVIRE